jgi:hypothetical protein
MRTPSAFMVDTEILIRPLSCIKAGVTSKSTIVGTASPSSPCVVVLPGSLVVSPGGSPVVVPGSCVEVVGTSSPVLAGTGSVVVELHPSSQTTPLGGSHGATQAEAATTKDPMMRGARRDGMASLRSTLKTGR